jgi:CheY-like chemotaxis protein
VKCALDGREALAVMRRQPTAALVILDLAMPIMNGEAFREEQAKDPAIARVPVIVLSGDGQLPKRGADGSVVWLRKPIELDELIEAVQSHGAWRAEPSPPHEDGGVDDAR